MPDASDFKDDTGDWSAPTTRSLRKTCSAIILFFGDTLVQQKIDEGFQPYEDPGFDRGFRSDLRRELRDTVQLFERDGRLVAFGVMSQAALALLMARYTGIDWSNMQVAVPPKGDAVPPTASAARVRRHCRKRTPSTCASM